MFNKIKTKLSLLILLVLILATSFTGYTANGSINVLTSTQQPAISQAQTESQISPRFPEEKPTDRIYAQGRRIFKGYTKQGEIIVENHGAKSASVYINGKSVSITNALTNKEGTVTIDISKFTVNGDNAIKVLNVEPKDTYINIFIPYPTLTVGKPKEVGFSEKKLAELDKFINEEVEKGFPGAVLLVLKDGKIIKNTAYGYKLKYDKDKLLDEFDPMDSDTLFDLASNTKCLQLT